MPRENETLQRIKAGSTVIEVRRYADGRYGYDYRLPGEERKKVRLWSLEKATDKAKRDAEKLSIGRAELLTVSDEQFARFLKFEKERASKATFPALAAAFLQSKEGKGRSEWTLDSLSGVLDKFAEAFPCPIGQISRADVEGWLNGRGVGPRRWNNMLAAIVAVYRFARRDGAIGSEITPVERIEKKKARTKIETFTPEELAGILAAVDKEWLPAVVFGAFAGLRPEEVCPEPKTAKPSLCWEHVLWSKGKIDVPAEVSKVRRRRFVPLQPAAAAFLADWRDKKGPVLPRKKLSNEIRKWAERSGVRWRNDGLRHSYASYRLALTSNIHELSLEMGNSPKIIHDHYLDLKHEDEAQEWFAIRPAIAPNVVPMAV